MKKIALLLFSSLMSLAGHGQESIEFQIKISPNTIYTTKILTSTNGLIDFVAEDAFMEQLKASGVESPMKMEQEMNMTLVATNGNKTENGAIPVTVEYQEMITKTVINGEPVVQNQTYEGMRIMGKYTSENKFEIDSIIGEGVTDQLKEVMTSTMDNLQKQIQFPEEPIVVGDTFNNEIPMAIPMQGMNPVEIIIKTKYLLKEIKNNIAFFDVDQSISISTEQEQFNMTASGSGTGKAEYSVDKNYLTKYESTLPMELFVKINEQLSIEMKMDVKSSMTVTIE